MRDEYSDRHQAIQMRLAGQSVAQVCRNLRRSLRWFHKWWSRYLAQGPDGLFDLTRAAHQVARRISPELERTILTIRRRVVSLEILSQNFERNSALIRIGNSQM